MRIERKRNFQDLFWSNYLKALIVSNRLQANVEALDKLFNVVESKVGLLSNTFQFVEGFKVKNETISTCFDCFTDEYILIKSYRYDIKCHSYIDNPLDYYFIYIGLRNVCLTFRQQVKNHIVVNIIYNECFCT